MDIKIIINAFIIIFILHIIIININYSKNIGKKWYNEKSSVSNLENFNSNEKKSIDFLTDSKANVKNIDSDFQKKLLNYIKQPEPIEKIEFEKKNALPVLPGNTYLSSNNEPNFESNVANIKKFYDVNYDNLDENSLQSTSIDNLSKITQLYDTNEVNQINEMTEINEIKGKNKMLRSNLEMNDSPNNSDKDNVQSPFNVTHFGRNSTVNPDTWLYKDDLPMNGGKMGNVFGFDQLESQFAIYNPNKMTLEASESSNFKNIPHDDLRKPIVYEN